MTCQDVVLHEARPHIKKTLCLQPLIITMVPLFKFVDRHKVSREVWVEVEFTIDHREAAVVQIGSNVTNMNYGNRVNSYIRSSCVLEDCVTMLEECEIQSVVQVRKTGERLTAWMPAGPTEKEEC